MTDHQKTSTHDAGDRSAFTKGVVMLAVGAFLVSILGAAPTPTETQCTLTFQPEAVVAGGEAAEIRAIPSEEIPVPDALTFQEQSGLTGELVDERPFHFTVNLADAREGEWTVTMHQDEVPVCTGTLRVTPPAL